MKTQLKIVCFWLGVNYNQLFIIFCLIFFCGQICRIIFKF